MIQTISAKDINLRYLIDHFGVKRIREPQFFPEWQNNLPQLTDLEKQELDRIQAGYFNLLENPPVLENVVQLAIISPLLFVGGFYLSPYQIQREQSIHIQQQDEETLIEGRIDILILNNSFWATIIESKQLSFSLETAIPQLLTYLLAAPYTPSYGMATNGGDFQFVKLLNETTPQYSLSNKFFIENQENDLYRVLQILKQLTDKNE